MQILGYASVIHEKLKHSLIKSARPPKKPFSRIYSPTCARCHRCLSNTHELWLTHLDADFSGRASADEFDKAAPLRPNVSALHASEGAGLPPTSAHWDPLHPWPAALRYICTATHTGSEFIYLQRGLRCDYYPAFSAGTVRLPEPIVLSLSVILMNCFFLLLLSASRLHEGFGRFDMNPLCPPTAAPVWRSTRFQLLLRPVYLPVTCLV